MDPGTIAGLMLGGASLAIQIFDGIKKGYDYFEYAANMPEELESFRLGLRIVYTKLLDWAVVAGLSDVAEHAKFDKKYQANGHLIMAILAETNALFQYLQKDYNELILTASDISGMSETTLIASTNNNTGSSLRVHVSPPPSPEPPKLRPTAKDELSGIDVRTFAMFQPHNIPRSQQKSASSVQRVLSLANKVKSVVKEPKRVKWATFDREKYHEALEKLNRLTDYLHQTTGDYQLELLNQSARETCLTMLRLAQSVDDMKHLLEGARIINIPDPELNSDSASIFSQAPTLVNAKESSQNNMGAQGPLFERLTMFSIEFAKIDSSETLSGTRLDAALDFHIELEVEKDQGSRSLAKYGKKQVWVEWKEFSPVPVIVEGQQSSFWDIAPQLLKRLDHLSVLLERQDKPKEFSVPNCLGYFEDKSQTSDADRIGFVFDIPSHPPTSLYEILTNSVSESAIGDRIKVAQSISVSLFYIHAVNWLHKGLRSASIIFFQPDSADNSDKAWEPFISGFHYARPSTNTVTSTRPPDDLLWTVYSHPDYQGIDAKNYQKMFDIYSLGIILLEIALWKPADAIFGITESVRDEEARAKRTVESMGLTKDEVEKYVKQRGEDVKAKLLKRTRERVLQDEKGWLKTVRYVMGERYCNAVKACISGLDVADTVQNGGEMERVGDAVIQQAYLRQVIDELQGIRV